MKPLAVIAALLLAPGCGGKDKPDCDKLAEHAGEVLTARLAGDAARSSRRTTAVAVTRDACLDGRYSGEQVRCQLDATTREAMLACSGIHEPEPEAPLVPAPAAPTPPAGPRGCTSGPQECATSAAYLYFTLMQAFITAFVDGPEECEQRVPRVQAAMAAPAVDQDLAAVLEMLATKDVARAAEPLIWLPASSEHANLKAKHDALFVYGSRTDCDLERLWNTQVRDPVYTLLAPYFRNTGAP